MFAPVALTIVFALAGSLPLSMTFKAGALSSLLLKGKGACGIVADALRLDRAYCCCSTPFCGARDSRHAGAGVALLLGTAAYLGSGKTFMPTMIARPADGRLRPVGRPGSIFERALDLRCSCSARSSPAEVEHRHRESARRTRPDPDGVQ